MSIYKYVNLKVKFEHKDGSFLILSAFKIGINKSRKMDIYHGEIKDEKVIASISRDVNKMCKYNQSRFTPKWTYIVSWFDLENDFIGNYSNIFQLIMTSNGKDSFAIFKYVRLKFNFDLTFYTFIGYFMADTLRSYKISLEEKSMRNLIEKSNMNRSGQWFISFNNTNCHFT